MSSCTSAIAAAIAAFIGFCTSPSESRLLRSLWNRANSGRCGSSWSQMRLLSSFGFVTCISTSFRWRSPAAAQRACRMPGFPLRATGSFCSSTRRCRSRSFSSSRSATPTAVGWCARIETSADTVFLLQSKLLRIFNDPPAVSRNSASRVVSAPASRVNVVGRSENSHVMATVLSSLWTLASLASILDLPPCPRTRSHP
ncbi:hypothetical protein D9M69_426170 [compost metagenome]